MSMQQVKKPIRALVIEDREDDALLLVTALKRGGYKVDYQRVETVDSLSQAMTQQWDIIFSDHSMPTMTGTEALAVVRQHNQVIPFIFVSGTIGEDIAVESMRKGAQDYIMKDNLKRLLPAVQRELHDSKMRAAQRQAEQRLHYLAHYDSLTGLPNRFFFIEQLENCIRQTRGDEALIAVIYVDLDRFKSINDSLGYEAGNQLLKKAANRLAELVGDKGVAARLATDEFALLLKQQLTKTEVVEFVETLLQALEVPYDIHGWSMHTSASIGVSIYPDHAGSAADLLGKADIATYRAKDEGGRSFLFYTPAMAVQLEERLALERHMRKGMENNEFFLHYQPQFDFSNSTIVGVEALLRWNNEEHGNVSPAVFIPLAEETGFIFPLSEWVLRQACMQVKAWQNAGLPPIRVAVNISARQFHQETLPGLVAQLLKDYALDAELLELEITETAIMRDESRAIQTLNEIKALGVKVALDDFGTGYSSLSYLKAFKTDYLKIDQTFIRGLPDNKDDKEIVSAIIAMAEKLSMKTIAEGAETEAQFNFLKAQGCNMVQGYYISRPVLPQALEQILKKQVSGGQP